jgi:hypothetical protein
MTIIEGPSSTFKFGSQTKKETMVNIIKVTHSSVNIKLQPCHEHEPNNRLVHLQYLIGPKDTPTTSNYIFWLLDKHVA